MSEFRWHLMDNEFPPTGYGHYIIMGRRGGMYIADNFETAPYSDYHCFHVPNVRGNYKYDHEVKAWAEIPPFWSDDTCHITYCEDDYGMDGWLCNGCGEWFAATFNHTPLSNIRNPRFCPNCGRKVV